MQIIFSLVSCVFVSANLFAADYNATGVMVFSPYSHSFIDKFKGAIKLSHAKQIDFLKSSASLEVRNKKNSKALSLDEKYRLFVGHAPVIGWRDSGSRIPCDAVEHAHESVGYLIEKFRRLRQESLNLLGALEISEAEEIDRIYEKSSEVTNEMLIILEMVEKEFPPSFYELDLVATYYFKDSLDFKSKFKNKAYTPKEKLFVEKIKFGQNPWLKVSSGIKGLLNIFQASVDKKNGGEVETGSDGNNGWCITM